MRDLSLHILDIVQNSIDAAADFIQVTVDVQPKEDRLVITVSDNGRGMDEALVEKITDPFVTGRTTRKVGLGLALLEAAVQRSDGDLSISSRPGVGTTVTARFRYRHIDRPPMGDLTQTIISLILCNPDIDFLFRYIYGQREFKLDTREIRAHIGDMDINDIRIVDWIREYVQAGIEGKID
ncbi:MAG TPA: ATP-binding protein [Clostridiales bacterium]|jgi:anti-sigma regulatory factor (Ser/Thr protein kinase)|nr:ATP-binding protein [Clostridiales bacterium]